MSSDKASRDTFLSQYLILSTSSTDDDHDDHDDHDDDHDDIPISLHLPTLIPITQERILRMTDMAFYRYLNPTPHCRGLQSFYGDNRSFCQGQIFDNSLDFYVIFRHHGHIIPINHHPHCYQGRLYPQNTTILGLIFRNPPLNCDVEDFRIFLNDFIQQCPPRTIFYESNSYPSDSTFQVRRSFRQLV